MSCFFCLSDYDAASADLPSVKFLNCNLGWTPPLYYHFGQGVPRRAAVIRFAQEGGETFDFPVEQREGNPVPDNGGQVYSAAFYQWGRKDPFLPGKSLSPESRNRIYYSESEYAIASAFGRTLSSGGLEISGKEVALPYIYHNSYKDGEYSRMKYFVAEKPISFYNISGDKISLEPLDIDTETYHWNIKGSGHNLESVSKTIYDPSPAGFCVPFHLAFSGLYSGSVSEPAYYTGGVVSTLKKLYLLSNASDFLKTRESVQYIHPVTNGFLGNYVASKGVYFPNDATATGVKDFLIPFCGWRSNDYGGEITFLIDNPIYAEGPWTSGHKRTGPSWANLADNSSYSGYSMTMIGGVGYNAASQFVIFKDDAYIKFNFYTRGNPVRPILEQ